MKPLLSTGFAVLMLGQAYAVSEYTENGENGTGGVIIDTNGHIYDVLQNSVSAEGDYAFHLVNDYLAGGNYDTSFELDVDIEPTASTKLSFLSRLGLAFSGSAALVEVSTNGGSSWSIVYEQLGTSTSGASDQVTDPGFIPRSVDLGSYAGQTLRLRFLLDFRGGSIFQGTSTSVGWLIDNIQIGIGGSAKVIYDIGDPSAEETLTLEYINRARLDPLNEYDRFLASDDEDIVDTLDFLKNRSTRTNPPLADLTDASVNAQQQYLIDQGIIGRSPQDPTAPPLAFNRILLTGARLHCQDMLQNEFQGHTSSSGVANVADGLPYGPGASIGTRYGSLGFSYSLIGENVGAYIKNLYEGHAAFWIDWDPYDNVDSPGSDGYNASFSGNGIQNPPGHRKNIHNAVMKEIGVGVTFGTNGSVGPVQITHAIGLAQGSPAFITGVVYRDFNNNDFYDLGEGWGGVRIDAEPADQDTLPTAFYAITSASGAYALPVSGDGLYEVTFSSAQDGLATSQVQIQSVENVKLDWHPQILRTTAVELLQGTAEVAVHFIDASFDNAPELWTTSSLGTPFTKNASAILQDRQADGSRAFHISTVDESTPVQFYQVVIPE